MVGFVILLGCPAPSILDSGDFCFFILFYFVVVCLPFPVAFTGLVKTLNQIYLVELWFKNKQYLNFLLDKLCHSAYYSFSDYNICS